MAWVCLQKRNTRRLSTIERVMNIWIITAAKSSSLMYLRLTICYVLNVFSVFGSRMLFIIFTLSILKWFKSSNKLGVYWCNAVIKFSGTLHVVPCENIFKNLLSFDIFPSNSFSCCYYCSVCGCSMVLFGSLFCCYCLVMRDFLAMLRWWSSHLRHLHMQTYSSHITITANNKTKII